MYSSNLKVDVFLLLTFVMSRSLRDAAFMAMTTMTERNDRKRKRTTRFILLHGYYPA